MNHKKAKEVIQFPVSYLVISNLSKYISSNRNDELITYFHEFSKYLPTNLRFFFPNFICLCFYEAEFIFKKIMKKFVDSEFVKTCNELVRLKQLAFQQLNS